MSMKITAWLVDAGTEHTRLVLGEKWPGGAYAQSLVLMIDAQNAVHAEQRDCEVLCGAALNDKDAEIERLRAALLIGHTYAECCPTPASPDDRDQDCQACAALGPNV